MFRESHLRSAIKAVSWRFWATVTTMLLVYLFTGTIEVALAIGGLEVILKMLIFYLHERTWDKIRLGKKEVTPFVLWLTGLPASGKTTLANAVHKRLSSNGYKVERLDGDTVRSIFPSTGFSRDERNTHIQRVGFLASTLERNGISVVASFISPYQDSRSFARSLCRNFVEVHVSTPLEECEKRDTKGLYERARRGVIKNLTGIDDPYEVPEDPELTIDSARESVEKSVDKITKYLTDRKFLS
ncbi:MAG: adenylyl-sulfate kinase [candidate division Zixibacteria bacterium]|nr:adenylyl-sulfate kinase [candidate division Zixibacteria bacterium]